MSDKQTAYRGESFHSQNEGDVTQNYYGVDPTTGQPLHQWQQGQQGYGAAHQESPYAGQNGYAPQASGYGYEQLPDAQFHESQGQGYFQSGQHADYSQQGYQPGVGQLTEAQAYNYGQEQGDAGHHGYGQADYGQQAEYGEQGQQGHYSQADYYNQYAAQSGDYPQDQYGASHGEEVNPYLAAHQNATPPFDASAHSFAHQYGDANAQYAESYQDPQQYYQHAQVDQGQAPALYNGGHEAMAAQQYGAGALAADAYGYDQSYTDYNGQFNGHPMQPQPQGMQQLNDPYAPAPLQAAQADASLASEYQSSGRKSFLVGTMILGSVIVGGGVAFAYKYSGDTGQTRAPIVLSDGGDAKVAPDNPGGREFENKNKKIFARLGDAGATVESAVVTSGEPEVVQSLRGSKNDEQKVAAAPQEDAGGPRLVRTYRIDRNGDRLAEVSDRAAVAESQVQDMVGVTVDTPKARAVKTLRAGNAVETQKDQRTASIKRPAPAAVASDGSYVVQISARRSQQDALAAFSGLQAKYSDVLSGYRPLIQKADLGAKGVYYRLRVGPMASKETASSVCGQLKAKGLSSCFVSTR